MNVQRTIARLMLKLPEGVLRAMSGGHPVTLGGRTLDAHFQFIATQAAKQPPPDPFTVEAGRAGTDMLSFMFGGSPEPGVSWTDRTIPGAAGRAIPVRVYRPERQRATAPAMTYLHFGGGVVGGIETCHAFCTILAKEIGCPIVSVNYRLAPEHPWPAGLDDSRAAFEWTRDHAGELGAPAGAAAIGGDSMGGNFSAIIAQDMAGSGSAQPFFQLLIYPATDLLAEGGSMATYGQSFPLTADTMAWFMAHYLPEGTDRSDLRLSPLRAPDLSGLAPALVATAGFDPLLDQGRAYAEALEQAGVSVQYVCFDALAHGFTAFTGGVPAADAACRAIARQTARAYRALGG
jgi:acetyl esterase